MTEVVREDIDLCGMCGIEVVFVARVGRQGRRKYWRPRYDILRYLLWFYRL